MKVFISSTFLDNEERRQLVKDALVDAGFVVVERLTASSEPTVQACQARVRECDCLVGILAHRYGWIPPNQPEGEQRSITEIEYDAAKGMPRLMFMIDRSVAVHPDKDFDEGPDRWKKQEKLEAFKARVSSDQMPTTFTDNELGVLVLRAVQAEQAKQAAQHEDEGKAPETVTTVPETSAELERYLAKAESLHREVQMIGFSTWVRATVQLDDLYVPLDAVLDRAGEGREVYSNAEHALKAKKGEALLQREELELAKAFGRARQLGKRGLILLGDPGSGKTTHLKQVLLQVVREGPESIGLPPGTVPVFLPLRNLEDRARGLPAFIQQELSSPLLDVAKDFGERLCRRGKVLYLLDGLDEVANANERAKVARWIEKSRRHAPESYFLVSCRYAGYSKDVELESAFIELHLRPLDERQMRAFVTNWYSLVEREALSDERQAELRAEQRSSELLRALTDRQVTATQRVYEMTRNPLLLTAICLVHRDRGRLPRARGQLYEESIGVLLERWHSRPSGALHPSEAVQVLQPVAHWMHSEDQRTRATGQELRGPVHQGLSTLRHVQMTPEGFLAAVRNDSGLLTGWGVDEYGFMHLGFQEYLTAQRLRNTGLKNPQVFEELAKRFGDSWWKEVILLMLALPNPSVFEEFMRAVVRQPGFVDGWDSEMMQLCLAETAELSVRPFVELLEQHEPGDASLSVRQFVAAELLARTKPEILSELTEQLRVLPRVRRWWMKRTAADESASSAAVIRAGVELVRIPAGSFLMGSPDDEAGRWGDEGPQHRVKLEEFYLARTPVTNAQYREYMKKSPGVAEPEFWGDRRFNGDDQPVVGVSWEEAQAYCEWAGLGLPTEAQWEYACRAGTTTRYHSGDSEEDLARVGWYDGNSDGRLHPVGEREPNAWGLYDMHGNADEWCQDSWVGNYAGAEHREGDGLRKESVGDAFRVGRGGFFRDTARCARSACRGYRGPGARDFGLGFRPAQGHS